MKPTMKVKGDLYAKDYLIVELLKNLQQAKQQGKTYIEIPQEATPDHRAAILNVLAIPGVVVHRSGNILALSLETEGDR